MSVTGSRFTLWLTAAVLIAATPLLKAQEEGLHIPPGRNVNWQWRVTDSKGFRWDVNSHGQINDGTNNAYDGCLRLMINGSTFSAGGHGKLSEAGDEVETGPWRHNGIEVFRRIRVDRKRAYCRWVDVFTNKQAQTQKITVRYYTDFGYNTLGIQSSSGQESINKSDWALITRHGNISSPTLVHIFSSQTGRFKPKVTAPKGNDNLYYDFTLELKPNQPVALCLIEAQRHNLAEATEFLEGFDSYEEVQAMPVALRRILLNFSGAVLSLGRLDLPRHPRHDLAMMRNGDELLGTLQNEKVQLEAFFGTVELPLGRVVGLATTSPEEDQLLVALSDGQILAGKLLGGPLRLKLASGGEVTLQPHQFASLSCAISDEKPHKIQPDGPVMILRNGEQLLFDPAGAKGTFHTAHGPVQLDPESLAGMYFDTPDGGLQRVIFSNASVLSGLIDADELDLKLRFDSAGKIPIQWIDRLILTPQPRRLPDLTRVLLTNDDVLFARIGNESLRIVNASGEVDIPIDQLLQMKSEEGLGVKVQCRLQNGTVVTGQAQTTLIKLKIQPGPELEVYTGQIASLKAPRPTGASAESEDEAEGSADDASEEATREPIRPAAEASSRAEAEAAAQEAARRAKEEAAAREAAQKEAEARAAEAAREAARRRNAAP
jgi:hypothetical protein